MRSRRWLVLVKGAVQTAAAVVFAVAGTCFILAVVVGNSVVPVLDTEVAIVPDQVSP